MAILISPSELRSFPALGSGVEVGGICFVIFYSFWTLRCVIQTRLSQLPAYPPPPPPHQPCINGNLLDFGLWCALIFGLHCY